MVFLDPDFNVSVLGKSLLHGSRMPYSNALDFFWYSGSTDQRVLDSF
jgi:hypothetical protein